MSAELILSSPRPVPVPVTRRFLGLDLGKAIDFTALVLLEWTWPPAPEPPPPSAGPVRRARGPVYDVRALRRWPLGTSYMEICDWLVNLYRSFAAGPLGPRPVLPPVLIVDETGVGAAVVEMIAGALRAARVPGGHVAVTITGGAAVSQVPGVCGHFRVAKKVLASVLVTLFGGHRLRIAELPETAVLVREAQNFSVRITPAGNETYETWRESEHDDLVLALALACWAAEYGIGRAEGY